jgi:hypothetical protein
MSSNVLIIGVVVLLIALIAAFAFIQTRPQKTWLGQLIDDSGGLGAVVGAFV